MTLSEVEGGARSRNPERSLRRISAPLAGPTPPARLKGARFGNVRHLFADSGALPRNIRLNLDLRMCRRCGDILREDLQKRSSAEMHVIVWGVTSPSTKPIRAVRLPSAEDPRLLAGEFAAIVFCDHFLVNNFCVEVFGDERYNSCGYAVPTPHGSGVISCEPPLDFATWCYGYLADKNEDIDLTDVYERAARNGEVQPGGRVN